jgi:hypothetical protein
MFIFMKNNSVLLINGLNVFYEILFHSCTLVIFIICLEQKFIYIQCE